MTSAEIRSKYLEFFKKRGHAIIPSASLIPENDPSSLFTTAGMQPLVPYLLGEKHPAGTRLVDVQKCVRTGDIDDVGDNRHLTFFEMLGNWSLGDYFKKEAINWSFEFLTSKEEGLGLDPKRIYVTVFKGENGIPRDEESIKIWQEVFKKTGIQAEVADEDEIMSEHTRIIPLGVKDNFWIAGSAGPCGGDTEMFYDTQPELGQPAGKFSDFVDSFRFIEVWNDVFMEFNKTEDGQYDRLSKKNVDTGMGLERTTAVVQGKDHVFDTDLFQPILEKIRGLSDKNIYLENKDIATKSERIVADHMRTAVFMIADGVTPSNTDRGHVLRRLLRRAVRYSDVLHLKPDSLEVLVDEIIEKYAGVYMLGEKIQIIKDEIKIEEDKFRKTLEKGIQELTKLLKKHPRITGEDAFNLYQSFGLPLELTKELGEQITNIHDKSIIQNAEMFFEKMNEHQKLSRAGSEKKFKGGLGDTSEKSIQYHTATHLLNAALRKVLGDHVGQRGSNITHERLRFDFSHNQKLTEEEKRKVEELVNNWIQEALPVNFTEMPKEEAEKIAIHAFNEKYSDTVKVYSIGPDKSGNYISREFCGGPHVSNTSGLKGKFKIQKEESVSQGVRRIKAVLE